MERCKIYGHVYSIDGNPLEGIQVVAILDKYPMITSSGFAVSRAIKYCYTTSSGYFQLDLLSGLDVVVRIPFIGFSERIRVPSMSECSLFSLIGINETDVLLNNDNTNVNNNNVVSPSYNTNIDNW